MQTKRTLNWHQFGIITHAKKVSESFQTKAQEYFKQWGIKEHIDKKLSDQIDGKTKEELLQISIALHDLDKFARSFKEKDGEIVPDYTDHEAKSKALIQENGDIQNLLHKECGLSDSQIRYIADCVGFHYELGKMRNEAKETDLGYSIDFAKSEQCKEVCDEIAGKFQEYKEEIGILYLCDSLAKTDIEIEAETDQKIEAQSHQIEQTIREKPLNLKLMEAVKQRPVNIAIAKRYLEIICGQVFDGQERKIT